MSGSRGKLLVGLVLKQNRKQSEQREELLEPDVSPRNINESELSSVSPIYQEASISVEQNDVQQAVPEMSSSSMTLPSFSLESEAEPVNIESRPLAVYSFPSVDTTPEIASVSSNVENIDPNIHSGLDKLQLAVNSFSSVDKPPETASVFRNVEDSINTDSGLDNQQLAAYSFSSIDKPPEIASVSINVEKFDSITDLGLENQQLSQAGSSNNWGNLKYKLRRLSGKKYAISPIHSNESDCYDSDRDPEYLELRKENGSLSSETSSSETLMQHDNMDDHEEHDVKKGKKRKLNKDDWSVRQAKMRRNCGLSYISTSKSRREYAAREMRPSCGEKCRLQCSSKIDDTERKKIFDSYWALGDSHKQRCFIAGCMSTIKPKYRYSSTQNHRDFNHAFYFDLNGRIRVCKKFFKATLDINDRPIRTVIAKKQETGVVGGDLRGHNPHPTVPLEIKNGVREHIESIPKIESHYLRSQTTREYIDGGRSLTDIWRDYKENCVKAGRQFANLCMFSRIFNTEYNISFYIPKKDQCELCTAFQNAEGGDKQNLQSKYNEHQTEKELSRKEKNEDKSKVSNNYVVAVYDLQAVLPCPRGDVSVFYYKSKLNCFNFTITELSTKKTECYLWHEGESKRGVEEIASCVLMFIEKTVQNAETDFDFIFYSDNCRGQQKNKFMVAAYYYAVLKFPQIKSLTHKYLITGHTQNEGDSVHSVIEKQIKKSLRSGPIYIPAQYAQLIRSAEKNGDPYNVNESCHKDFLNIKALNEQLQINLSSLKITEVKVMKIVRDNLTKLFVKRTYSDEEFQEINITRRSLGVIENVPILNPVYKNKLKIKDNKRQDLLALLKSNHIKKFYADFFEQL